LPESAGRRRAVSVALIAAALIVSIIPTVATSTTPPPGLDRFLYALGEIETGGNYDARNSSSGAYGKYQILPSNWPTWARLYIDSSTALPTPTNQERVARGKVTALYHWLDSWPNVAHWWLTGSGETNHDLWSSTSRNYVNRLMTIYRAGTTVPIVPLVPTAPIAPTVPASPATTAAATVHVEQSAAVIDYAGGWTIARLGAYTDGRVKYSVRDGATATFAFTGRSVVWTGPVGPTRGRASVLIDGVAVGTVDLRRSSFRARATLFRTTWAEAGQHTVTIKVVGSGRPVAIDEFVVGS
jgi:hypothetical protein